MPSALAVYSAVSKLTWTWDLGGQIIDFVRLGFLHDTDEIGRICHVAVVQINTHGFFVGVLVEVVDTARIKDLMSGA